MRMPGRHNLTWLCTALLWALAACPSNAQTLREALTDSGIAPENAKLANLDRDIDGEAQVADEAQFVIAYYLDNDTENLKAPLFLDRLDRKTGKWRSAIIANPATKSDDTPVSCAGAVLNVKPIEDRLLVETHLNPSAGCLLIFSDELRLEKSLYGWQVGQLGPSGIVYHRSEIHFAPVHPAEIALYDLKTGREEQLFPRRPFQAIRLARVAQLKDFYDTHQDWCRANNDPCDPQQFDSSLEGPVVSDEPQDALAFVISYEQVQLFAGEVQKPSGPKQVLYVFRHVSDEAKLEYRERLMSDVTAHFGDVKLEDLLTPEKLQWLFAPTTSQAKRRILPKTATATAAAGSEK